MSNTRREFLMVAGISALGVSAAPVVRAFAASGGDAPKVVMQKGEKALTATRWAMVIDTRELTTAGDLEPIIEACDKTHNIPKFENHDHEIKWIWEEEYKHAFPGKENKYLNEDLVHRPFLVLCNHCENPPCVQACPTQATFQREDGIVLMDFHRCIGCRFCMAACPYGARSFNFVDPRPAIPEENKQFPTRMKGVVEKCNLCAERLAEGLQPACAEASGGAIVVGDLEDPESEVRKLLNENYTIRRKEGLGTGPCVYYIV